MSGRQPVGLGGNDVQLRIATQVARRTAGAVEGLSFVVVETEVDVAQGGLITDFSGDDGPDVVEIPASLVGGQGCPRIVYLGARQRIAERSHHIIAAIDADTGGIGPHGGDVSAQGTHRPAHAHEAGRSVQVLLGDGGSVIYGLCGRAGSRQEGAGQYQDFGFHCHCPFKKKQVGTVCQRRRLPPPEREPPPLRTPPDERNEPPPPVENVEREVPDR